MSCSWNWSNDRRAYTIDLGDLSVVELAEACAVLGGPGGLSPAQVTQLSADHITALGPRNLWADQVAAWLRTQLAELSDGCRGVYLTLAELTPLQWTRLEAELTPHEYSTFRRFIESTHI